MSLLIVGEWRCFRKNLSRVLILLWLVQIAIPFGVNAPKPAYTYEDENGEAIALTHVDLNLTYSEKQKDSGFLRVTHPFFPLPTSREGSLTNKDLPPSLLVGKGERGMGNPQGAGLGLPVLFLFSVLVEHFLAEKPNAAVCTWNGATDSSWSNNSNWTGSVVPGASDTAIFDTNGTKGCNINAVANVKKLQINGGYTRTIIQKSSFTITVGSSGFSQAGGTFTGGSNKIVINGGFTITGGTFTSTADSLCLGSNATISGGVFNHNNGCIQIDGGSNSTVGVGTAVLFNVRINKPSFMLGVTDTMKIIGNLTFSALNSLTGGAISVEGNVISTQPGIGGLGVVRFNGGNAQTFSALGNGGGLPNVIINKSGNTLTLQDTLRVSGNFKYMAGGVNAGTGTVEFNGSNP